MSPVFAHGRLRLYLLKLLDEAPRHGYEVIRLLEERFQGLYAPSAGTVYPRLAKLEAEGLVTHTTEGGRKVYSITDAGRAELADRSGELADLELEIRESVAELAAEIREDVRDAAGDLRREMRAAASAARQAATGRKGGRGKPSGAGDGTDHLTDLLDLGGKLSDKEAWRAAKEELRRAKQEWKEQARRAKDETRRARDEAQRARRQAKEAQEQARAQAERDLHRIARQVQERMQEQIQLYFGRGDWPTDVREGLTDLARQFTESGWAFTRDKGTSDTGPGAPSASDATRKPAAGPDTGSGKEPAPGEGPGQDPSGPAAPTKDGPPAPDQAPPDATPVVTYVPPWAHETASTGDPARDLDRLLDRFRDDIRDAARDYGVTEEQLRDARRHLSTAAAHIGAVLRGPLQEHKPDDN